MKELKDWSKSILQYYLNNHDYTNYKIVREYNRFIIYYNNNNKIFYILNKQQYTKFNIINYKMEKQYFHNCYLFYLNNKNNEINFYKLQGIKSIYNNNTKIVKIYNKKFLQINKKFYYNYSENIYFCYYYPKIKQYIIYLYIYKKCDDFYFKETDIKQLNYYHYSIIFLFIFVLFI